MKTDKTGQIWSAGRDFTDCPELMPQLGAHVLYQDADCDYIAEITDVRNVPQTAGYYTYPTIVTYRLVAKVAIGRGSEEAERLRLAGKLI